MVIEENNSKIKFKELKIGDVFRCNDIIYIRTSYLTTDTGYDFDAYDLDNDDFCNFSDNDIVEKVKAKLVIE